MRIPQAFVSACIALFCSAQQPFDLDTSFRTPIIQRNVNSILPQQDGKLVLSGRMLFPGALNEHLLVRIDQDGLLDPTFYASSLGGGKLTSWSGQFYVAANSTVRRILPDGHQDPSFIGMNTGPYFTSGQGGDYHVYPDGRVLMTGVHVLSDSIRGFEGFYSLVWFSNTGYLDTTAIHRKCDNTIDLIHPLPNGEFLLSGWLNTYEGQPVGRIFRVHPDGALDSSFHTSIYWGMATDLLVQPDNKIVATGRFLMNGDPDTLHLIRLFPDGALDSTFNNHLRSSYHQFGGFFSWSGITSVSPLGHIVYGAFTSIDEQPRRGIALVDTSGVLLNTYFSGTGCGVYEYMGFPYSSVESLIPDPVGGGYYICGAYTGYDDGTVDDTTQRFVSRLYGLDVGVREEPVKEPGASLLIHPNPASTWVAVSYGLDPQPANASISIRDLMGREVHRAPISAATGQLLWDTRQVPAGSYAVVLLGAANGPVTQQLIVQP
ncbi:MAG: hypothetical protein IPM49_02965 [Flavobacteriales bacterium]|nr:hypothetical protein [Flavobacteriales bacterium]